MTLVADADPVARHRAASRITLRQLVLAELDNVHLGKTFERYEQRDGHIVAHFEDGTRAEGDIPVAADGGGSRVRRQFLPHAPRIDTGVLGDYDSDALPPVKRLTVRRPGEE
jgi:2-polyprenyl-6-methoxyphenol hydroxylase-like FAD-dependent oxidoreductase